MSEPITPVTSIKVVSTTGVQPAKIVPRSTVPPPPATAAGAVPAIPSPTLPSTSGMASAVNKAVGLKIPIPAGLKFFNTKDLESPYFHGIIYGDTDARKTSTAVQFAPPEDMLVVLSRQKEQLIPLKNRGYNVLWCNTADHLNYALNYPEQAADAFGFTTWKDRPDRTLVVDDISESVNLYLEEYETIDGKEVKDARRTYKEAGKDIRAAVQSLRRKPLHLILIALAAVKEYELTNEERIIPAVPPSVMNLIGADLEYCFYINKQTWKMTTTSTLKSYKTTNPDTGKDQVFNRVTFAKNKLPLEMQKKQPPVLRVEEDLDLRAVWERIKSGESAPVR